MYDVLIVDDDVLTRTELEYLLKQSNRYHLTGQAENGAQALDIMDQKHIDIVLTDMKMPVMDGVALSRAIRKYYPDTAVVAISNYDEFHYVQESLRCGVKDYILKSEITEASLFQALDNAAVYLNRKYDGTVRELTDEAVTVLSNRFVKNLISGFPGSKESIEAQIRFLKLPLKTEFMMPVIMRLKRTGGISQDIRERSLFEFSVTNICSELLNGTLSGVIAPVLGDTFCIIIGYDRVYSKGSAISAAHNLMKKISEVLGRLMNLRVYYQPGDICSDYRELPGAYRNAESRFPDVLAQKAADTSATSSLKESAQSLCQEFARSLNDTPEASEAALKKVIRCVQDKEYSRLAVQYVFSNLLQSTITAASDHEIRLSQKTVDDVRQLLLEDTVEVTEFQEGMHGLLESYYRSKTATEELSHYMRQALGYIDSHLHENISMTAVAEIIGISSNYLSKLFNTEVHTSFPSYILDKRLDQAISMMNQGKGSVREIASACGFQSYEYFFYVFKKKMHQTPKEYMTSKH